MKRLCLLLVFLCIMPVATSIAGGLEKPDLAIPKGALVIVSEWSLEGDTPKGFAKEVKVEPPQAELEGNFIKLSSKKSSFGFKKEIKFSVKDYPYAHWAWQARTLP